MSTADFMLKNIFVICFLGLSVLLAVQDHRHNLLTDGYTLLLLWMGLIGNATVLEFASLKDAVFGAIAGYLTIRILHDIFVMIRGKSGLGLGDAKFLAATGAWLGWQSIPLVIIGSSIIMLICYFQRSQKPLGVGIAVFTTILIIIHF